MHCCQDFRVFFVVGEYPCNFPREQRVFRGHVKVRGGHVKLVTAELKEVRAPECEFDCSSRLLIGH